MKKQKAKLILNGFGAFHQKLKGQYQTYNSRKLSAMIFKNKKDIVAFLFSI